MSDELKPFAWCYQTIAGVIVFQKWPASDKEWAQRNNDVAGATKYPNAHSVTDLYTAADLATLRTQLAAMTAERVCDEKRVNDLMVALDRVAKERDAALAKVAVLRVIEAGDDGAVSVPDNWTHASPPPRIRISERRPAKGARHAARARLIVVIGVARSGVPHERLHVLLRRRASYWWRGWDGQ